MIVKAEDHLEHYGTPRHSGRYPWGSGGEHATSHRNPSLLDTVKEFKSKGMSEGEIAKALGMKNTNELRAARTIELNARRQDQINMATRLKDKGLSQVAIGQRMGLNESSVRSLLAPGQKDKADVLNNTANMLKDQVDKKKYIDVGTGVERSLPLSGEASAHVGISETKFKTAIAMLQQQGYTVHYVKVRQLTTGKDTTMKVLAAPGTKYAEVFRNRDNIASISAYTHDQGRSYETPSLPMSISSKRIAVRYAEQGGSEADGVIFVRPGPKDLSLGQGNYAQVRIAVDGTHYLKGMAVYKSDLPDGVDLLFNTNKSDTGNKLDALKSIKDDPENPFGAVTRQIKENGKVTSVMNLVNEEGNWDNWKKTLPSQMLSKQNTSLAKRQLDTTFTRRQREFEAISQLTNPLVRKKLLDTFADETDSAAVHLAAAAIPRQATRVILPLSTLKENEIYAPSFRDGERVALIRFPHGGTFEIPQLTVNNRVNEGKQVLGTNPKDAVGIHYKTAQHLSGADFDGDHVLVIPNTRGDIKSTPPLEGLKGFDPSHAYPPYEGMKTIDGGVYNAKERRIDYGGKKPKGGTKQTEMGLITNLITDMSIHGANSEELARAIRHSMVIIDAEKHVLDYKASARDNGIAQLKTKYQGGPRAGAKTLISRATSTVYVNERKPRPASQGGSVDPVTGRRVFVETGKTYVDKHGRTQVSRQTSTRLAETHDAHTLSSGSAIEDIYANHSNQLKALANEARKSALVTKPLPRSKSAAVVYKPQVDSLLAKLNLAYKNRPLERQAQVIANAEVGARKRANPDMGPDELRKLSNQALIKARARTGAGKHHFDITQEEWNAIQAGAISKSKLEDILNYGNLDTIKKLATPRAARQLSTHQRSKAQRLFANGYTQAEVADQLGIALSTLKAAIGEGL